RLQKIMARAGLGARRKLELKIADGLVWVNGRKAVLGSGVCAGDRIDFEGSRYQVAAERRAHQTLIYYKPEGQVTTRDDPESRPTVFDHLPRVDNGRWIPVGRLDLNTTGLLLLTTDGELANRMMHPSGRVDREYLCRIRGKVADSQLEKLLAGVEIGDGKAHFSDLVIGEQTVGHTWYTVTIMEGRNREVRRLWEAVGAQVARLKRVRFGPVFLPSRLRPGHFDRLVPRDHKTLRTDVGLKGAPVELTLQKLDRAG
ncbi:MAG: pseudouridine synthase, partial [Xanthomonadaceae bacterium]|nr:pseudouridine synthase [Xanthomonadaceae bacterium]